MFANIQSKFYSDNSAFHQKEMLMDTLVKFTEHKPCYKSYDKIMTKIIDAGHLGIWRSIIHNFMFYKDGKKRNILQTGKSGSDLETVVCYIKTIFHCFDYTADDIDFDYRLHMPNYKPQIVLLNETAEPSLFLEPDHDE